MERMIKEFRMSIWLDSKLRRLSFEFRKPQRRGLPLAGPLGIDRINLWLHRRASLSVESIPEAGLFCLLFGWFEVAFIWRSKQRKNVT